MNNIVHATNEDFTEESEGISREASFAARVWRERMGSQRWVDDPRALREKMQQQSYTPPFYS